MVYTYKHIFPDKSQMTLTADLRGEDIVIESTPYLPEFKEEYLIWSKYVSEDIKSKMTPTQVINQTKKVASKILK